MPRTLLPRSALRNSDAVASNAPIDPVIDEKIIGPTSEPSSGPATQPSTQPSEEGPPIPPVDPDPRILLVHPKSSISGGVRIDAEGPIFARDPLSGAPELVLEMPRDFPKQVSLYNTIGRLVIFVRKVPGSLAWLTIDWNRYRKDFSGFAVPTVTSAVEFEAPCVRDEFDIRALVIFGKMFNAPKVTMWTYGHGAEVVVLATRKKTEAQIQAQLKPHKDFLLERTLSAKQIETIASGMPYYEVATEWFDPDETRPDPPRPKKTKTTKILRRAEAKVITCKEPDYSKVDFNEGAKLQRIEVETDLSIPLPPLK
jgi:hypothetical protein